MQFFRGSLRKHFRESCIKISQSTWNLSQRILLDIVKFTFPFSQHLNSLFDRVKILQILKMLPQ